MALTADRRKDKKANVLKPPPLFDVSFESVNGPCKKCYRFKMFTRGILLF
jgi:hypothetical protein